MVLLGVFTAGFAQGSAVSATAGAKNAEGIANAAKKKVGRNAEGSDSRVGTFTLNRENNDGLASNNQQQKSGELVFTKGILKNVPKAKGFAKAAGALPLVGTGAAVGKLIADALRNKGGIETSREDEPYSLPPSSLGQSGDGYYKIESYKQDDGSYFLNRCKEKPGCVVALVLLISLVVYLVRKILRENEPVAAENEIGNVANEDEVNIADVRNRIKKEFLKCLKDGEKNSNYENKVDYFLDFLFSRPHIIWDLIIRRIESFFEKLGESREIFAKLWKLGEFDNNAVVGFWNLYVRTDYFLMLGFDEGFALFLKSFSNNLKLVSLFFSKLGTVQYRKVSEAFAMFFIEIGIYPRPSSVPFDTNLVFPGLIKLLLKDDGDIDKDVFVGLMRAISGIKGGGYYVSNFLAILACVGESNNTIPAKNLAELLRQFARLRGYAVGWASENFANVLDSNVYNNYETFVSREVSYDVVKKIKDGSLDTKKFVEKLAATDPKSFSLEEFAKEQGLEEVVIEYASP